MRRVNIDGARCGRRDDAVRLADRASSDPIQVRRDVARNRDALPATRAVQTMVDANAKTRKTYRNDVVRTEASMPHPIGAFLSCEERSYTGESDEHPPQHDVRNRWF